MVGYGPNRGIVPITCDELFQTVENNSDTNRRFEVTFSMLEIYNEQVRDLLSKDNPKGGLQVRQNPKLGYFYVENLKKVPVGSYKEIEKRMEQGTASRTVASTNMNATSSRAHTVVTITFDQIIKDSDSGSETKKSSVMNLVDLAGSERADSTGAVGDRLKEGANINKSLSALGNVISALADLSMGTKKKIVVPYRDSVLTKLLQNALGGNSKTIMIAALSPADINYDETLSTLRYADRAKKIKNKAVINENPMDKLIRELKEENERLKKSMDGGGLIGHDMGMTPEEVEKMRKQMEEEIRAQLFANQEMLAQNTQSWEEQLAAARTETENITDNTAARKAKEPHLINLNEDPMLSGVICHFLSQKETTVGRKDAKPVPSICLSGLSIQKQHSVIYNSNGTVEVESVAGTGSKTKVNGIPLQGKKVLCHKDRVLFGSNHMYVFINPMKKSEAIPNQQIAQEQVLEILPMVSEVNAVSEELDKHKSFEVVLIATAATDGSDLSNNQGTKNADQNVRVMVKMKNLLNGNTWLWERGKFMNRRYLIQELYQRFLDGEDVSKVPKEEDPFWEPTEDVLIGTANVFLQSLCYALDFDDKVLITDYKGQEEGYLYVHVTPCAANGKPLDEESFVEDPKDLLSKPYNFKVTVNKAEINKVRFSKGINVKYSVKVEGKGDSVETPTIKNTLTPEFKHFKVIQISKLKKKHLEFFESKSICFHVYGTQEDTVPDPKLLKLTTRELRQMDSMEHGNPQNSVRRNTIFSAETMSDQSHLKTEVVLLQRKYERLQQKERRMQQICEDWKNKPEEEKQFEPFYRSVSAVAYSTGTRLRTRVQLLNSVLQGQKFVRDVQNGSTNGNKGKQKRRINSADGKPKDGSSACWNNRQPLDNCFRTESCVNLLSVCKTRGSDDTFKVSTPGTQYMLVDLGGGTVAITVHEKLSNGHLNEIHVASGDECGGNSLNQSLFPEMIRNFGGPFIKEIEKIYPKVYFDVHREFEAAKKASDLNSDEMSMSLPTIFIEALCKAMNLESLQQILNQGPHRGGLRLSAGNFLHISSELTVIIPRETDICVVNGAVMFGHTPTRISHRVSRYTYGSNISPMFVESVQDEKRKRVIDGAERFDGLFDIYFKIETVIETDTNVKRTYKTVGKFQKRLDLSLFASTRENPTYTNEEG
ncbi:Kinesin-like protein CIN8,Kinesin-like protein KIF16B,Kinesin-like protein KIN-12F,Kinesin-like protein Klp68D,Kinesin-like protein bimC,Kinesin-like protein KIF7,Kinesin-like protein KIN-14R,Kinesin-like protein Klp98A,Kinesin-like protein KIN-1,Kinesin-like protein KIN-14G,Kinesin-like protein 3,Kinesin-like protein KIF15-B,Kinesin-like protein KIF1B,Kinesin-like protein KIF19,Kinesin-like protein KIN-12A,Kinesin-like protein KIN-12E,Kinesin-like protein KIN-14D,Kinesin-like protein KIN-14F,Kinesin-like|uniref:Kinesin motor domain-containing protein n=1 Tax=Mytilus coruscus TaxID=42192 RepID=A0A6J8AR91_MYTCO|nr:Kinesin-like protein CIN8,Kinesin-like protein KIF16B,Kinesin-like protein KIN-12F,Kinesin-like protein Klp68D,Kinesin-like protein bimC,Kinesin-like protein KIF7,Kinesin-like protein KIN-14R,Kinesin-like protein Klp98A,Kinesin-like protein KIN-1,Kinesin-like protein KIN-14G,Kinesin-like protein 3,Kinesin-like protein KIF15-B,Kinesin-like protein KIF1B,Kinesin-like protein KIF19,Kinesin-like protein KIN-12A,Kinesin-like protein KIN-12E,Kinesin-like protein KIN-14D,Kinesin-like protein KIN-14F,Ki